MEIYPPHEHIGTRSGGIRSRRSRLQGTCRPQSFTQAFNSRTDAFRLVITFPNSTVRFRRVSRALYLALFNRTNRGEDFVRAEFRACGEGHGLAFQFKMRVIGDVASSTTVFIRNRWPSGETMYCCVERVCKAP